MIRMLAFHHQYRKNDCDPNTLGNELLPFRLKLPDTKFNKGLCWLHATGVTAWINLINIFDCSYRTFCVLLNLITFVVVHE